MIDEKTLARLEHHAISNNRHDYAEAFRHARRYLVLRRVAVKVYLGGDWIEGDELDADADRLLEDGE